MTRGACQSFRGPIAPGLGPRNPPVREIRARGFLCYEPYDDVGRAIEREKQIKGWSRRKKNALIAQSNPDWEDLWSTIAG
jgi:predicted GIY-YIG superfamily endonuclease